MYKTPVAKLKNLERKWYLIDAENKTLGRISTTIADILRGKNKPLFTPNVDCGDYVVVINADKVKLTGLKTDKKLYTTHSGYPGAIKHKTAATMLSEKPEAVLQTAVAGMLPRNRLKKVFMAKLKIFSGTQHNHEAQQPIKLDL